jgi:hypothetical protein
MRQSLGRIGHLKQHIRVAGLIERTPAGEILAAQAGAQIALIEGVTRVLPVKRNRFLDREFFSTN